MESNIFFTDYMMAGWYQCFGAAAAAGALQELSKAKRKKNEKKIIVAITLVQFWT